MYQQQTEKRRETILKLTLIKPIIFASLQHVKLPINVKIHVTKWQILYINMTALSSNLI